MDNIAWCLLFRCEQCVSYELRWERPHRRCVHHLCGVARRLSDIECGSTKRRWQLRKSLHPWIGCKESLVGCAAQRFWKTVTLWPCQEWCVNFYNFLKLSKIITSIFKRKVLVFYMSRYLVKRSPYISADRRLYWYWFILFFLLIYLKKC